MPPWPPTPAPNDPPSARFCGNPIICPEPPPQERMLEYCGIQWFDSNAKQMYMNCDGKWESYKTELPSKKIETSA